MKEKYYFEKNGHLVELKRDIVCKFKTNDGANYLAYTDYRKDSEGRFLIYGAEISEGNILIPMEEKDLYLIEESLIKLKENDGYDYVVTGDKND